jgi:hypothetical protein
MFLYSYTVSFEERAILEQLANARRNKASNMMKTFERNIDLKVSQVLTVLSESCDRSVVDSKEIIHAQRPLADLLNDFNGHIFLVFCA